MTLLLKALTDFLAANTAGEAKAQWDKGPTVPYKTTRGVSVADYVSWIKAAEDSATWKNQSSKQLVQRIRRVIYSDLVDKTTIGQTGTLADGLVKKVIDQTAPPLTTDHVTIDVLNGLYGTDTIRTASGREVDISHLWIPADAMLNGTTFGLNDLTNTATIPLVTWAGDLGSAVRNFIQAIKRGSPTTAQKTDLMIASLQQEALKEDLLGDFDAVVLSTWLKSLDTFVLSQEIERYYKDDDNPQAVVKLETHPKSARRFHWFVNLADEMKASGKASLPLQGVLEVTLDHPATTAKLKDILVGAAADVTKRFEFGINGDLDEHGGKPQLDKLADKFARFVEVGLATGDAPWPGTW